MATRKCETHIVFLLVSFVQFRVKFEALLEAGKVCFNIFVLGSVVSSFTVITTCNLVSWILTCRLESQGLRRCVETKGLRGIIH